MQEETYTFDPFSPEYEPRISNGMLEQISYTVENLATSMEHMQEFVNKAIDDQKTENKRVTQEVSAAVAEFRGNAQNIILALKKEVSEEVKAQVKAEIEKALAENDAPTPEEESAPF